MCKYSRAQVFTHRLDCRHRCILGWIICVYCSAHLNKGPHFDLVLGQLASDPVPGEKANDLNLRYS